MSACIRLLSLFIRPGKDSLFPISNLLDFEACGQSLFITGYAEVIQPGAIRTCFSIENHKNEAFQNHVQIRGRGTSQGH